MYMKHNVFKALVYYYPSLRFPEKLPQIQEGSSRYFREDPPCLFFDRLFFILA